MHTCLTHAPRWPQQPLLARDVLLMSLISGPQQKLEVLKLVVKAFMLMIHDCVVQVVKSVYSWSKLTCAKFKKKIDALLLSAKGRKGRLNPSALPKGNNASICTHLFTT